MVAGARLLCCYDCTDLALAFADPARFDRCVVLPRRSEYDGTNPWTVSQAEAVSGAHRLNHSYTAQYFQSKYAPHYVVSYSVCIVFAVGLISVTTFLWYFTGDAERQTREINARRRAAGKSGVVIKEDVHI